MVEGGGTGEEGKGERGVRERERVGEGEGRGEEGEGRKELGREEEGGKQNVEE